MQTDIQSNSPHNSSTREKQTKKKNLTDNEIKAFVNLLKDSDEKVLNIMAEQLASFHDDSINAIDVLANKSDDESLTENWYYASKQHLNRQISEWKKDSDLEQGLFLLARLHTPGINITHYQGVLDSYAERISKLLSPSSTHTQIIEAMNQILFKEEGFLGNQVDYYDLDNNFLHSVIDGKHGNPITLSAIYILIGKRLNLDIRGIGAPGHFIVQLEDTLIDPFFGGREISKDECVLRAQELSVYWREEYLDPIDDQFIIARCIRNLIAIYKKQKDFDRAADASKLLKLV